MTLSTPWARAMDLDVPVVNAPMGGIAGGRLARAVSDAGGLGMIGAGSAASVAVLRRELAVVRDSGSRFGVGLIGWKCAREPDLLSVALEASPTLVAVSFTEDFGWINLAKDAGASTAMQVSDPTSARQAEQAGVDVIVARGAEGGGHGEPEMGTLPLLEAVLDAVSVPVLAAGGIASSRGLAAILAAGAAGAWIGTAFAACRESLASDAARAQLIEAAGTDTVLTSVFDVALGYEWPRRFPERVLRNDYWELWAGREDELEGDAKARAALASAIVDDDVRIAHIDAGQGVGMVTEVATAAKVLERLCTGAESLLLAAGAGWST
ncbi:MAG TPA: nitronate monooxygenase [Acidimicrobiales bacterium]|nr:nitronate monooxygenase [Acidimicrobiales bacterium]